MALRIKRIKSGEPRAHVERDFTNIERPKVRRLNRTYVDQVDSGLKAGRVHSVPYLSTEPGPVPVPDGGGYLRRATASVLRWLRK